MTANLIAEVSVPLRGSGRERPSSAAFMYVYILLQSPCGEVVVKVQGSRYEVLHVRGGKFQSPCGEVVVKGPVRNGKKG